MFLKHKSKIKQLRTDFEQMSNETRSVAENSKTEVQRQTKKAGEIKVQMDKMIAEKGDGVKETDEYVELQQQFINATSAGTRTNTTLEKNIEWTTKYAARSNIFANLDRKLAIGATLLENKIKDFEESINIMKKDWEMAAASTRCNSYPERNSWPRRTKLETGIRFGVCCRTNIGRSCNDSSEP